MNYETLIETACIETACIETTQNTSCVAIKIKNLTTEDFNTNVRLWLGFTHNNTVPSTMQLFLFFPFHNTFRPQPAIIRCLDLPKLLYCIECTHSLRM
jgi:hypothetical protein